MAQASPPLPPTVLNCHVHIPSCVLLAHEIRQTTAYTKVTAYLFESSKQFELSDYAKVGRKREKNDGLLGCCAVYICWLYANN
jgi:hypothetical protein